MATKFFKLLTKVAREDPGFKRSSRKSMEWYREAAKKIKVTDPEAVARYYTDRPGIKRIRSKGDLGAQFTGRMILFKYDPLHKATLPYYDTLPMVFPLRFGKTRKNGRSMLGLNLHYLPYALRAKMMDGLYTIYQDKHLDENRRLKLSYELLNSSSRVPWFKPCVKLYLMNHIRSRFNIIDPTEWDFVLMLPLAQWQKATEGKVWADSRRIIGKS